MWQSCSALNGANPTTIPSRVRLHELIKALQSMRGISLIVAATIAAELGDLTRFENPGKLMAFLGLIPSEHSSGERGEKRCNYQNG